MIAGKEEDCMKAYKITWSRTKHYKEGMYILETEDELLYTHNPTNPETGEPFYGSWTDQQKDWFNDTDIDVYVTEYWYPKSVTSGEIIPGIKYTETGKEDWSQVDGNEEKNMITEKENIVLHQKLSADFANGCVDVLNIGMKKAAIAACILCGGSSIAVVIAAILAGVI